MILCHANSRVVIFIICIIIKCSQMLMQEKNVDIQSDLNSVNIKSTKMIVGHATNYFN